MKVLMIGTDRNIFIEGSAVRSRMTDYGKLFDELHIVIFTNKSNYKGDRVKISDNVFAYPTKSLNRWFYIKDAISLCVSILKDFKFDIHNSLVTSQDPFETGIVACRVAKKIGVKFQVQIHTDFLSPYFARHSFLNKFRVYVAMYIIPKAEVVRVVSSRIARSLISKNIKLKNPPVILPIYTDSLLSEEGLVDNNLRKKYGQFDFIFLSMSRLEREKNTELLIRSFEEVLKENPKVGFLIVGDGSQKDNLMRIAKSCGVENSVIFEPWTNDPYSYYKMADVFLSASLYEGYGLSIIEALSAGCVVISTDVGVSGEYLLDNQNGFVCPVKDQECFVLRMKESLKNKDLKEKFSVASKKILGPVKELTKEKYLESYKKTFEDSL